MSDELTRKFKEQLENMGSVSSPTNTSFSAPQNNMSNMQGRSLSDIIGGSQQQSEWNIQPDESGNLLAAVGKGVWSFGESALFGLPGFLLTDEQKEALQPKTALERATTGVGMAAGFMTGPIKLAVKGLGFGVKAFAKGGVTKFTKKYVDDTVDLMKQDKNFMSWAEKQVQRANVPETNVKDFIARLLDEPRDKLLSLGTQEGQSLVSRTISDRIKWSKNFQETLPKIMRQKFEEIGFRGRNAEELISTLGDDVLQRIGYSETSKNFRFPMLRLNQIIGARLGNTKLANIAGNAIEETAIFAAADLPLELIRSQTMGDDYDLSGQLQRGFILGTFLGVARPLIPGGMDQPILRTALNRISKTITNRRKWKNYELDVDKSRGIGREIVEADRARFETELKNVYNNSEDIFKEVRDIKKANLDRGTDADYGIPIGTGKRGWKKIQDKLKTKNGRDELKGIMVDVERTLYKEWWPKFVSDSMKDIGESSLRMLTGAVAFNYEMYTEYLDKGYPMEDIIFNTALGMFLSKRGQAFEYRNSKTGKLQTLYKERPLVYSDDLAKVDRYLQALGSNLDAGLYRAIYNEQEMLRKGFKNADPNSKDMVELKRIAVENGIIVDKFKGEDDNGNNIERDKSPGKVKVKGEDGKITLKERDNVFEDDIYGPFSHIVKNNFLDKASEIEQDVKQSYELDESTLNKIKKQLNDYQFDSLKEFTKPGDSGISKPSDLIDVVLGSGEASAQQYRTIAEDAFIDMYNSFLRIENPDTNEYIDRTAFDSGQILTVRPIALPQQMKDLNLPNSHYLNSMLGENSNLTSLLKTRLRYDKNPITITQEMLDKVFGRWEGGQRVRDEEAFMDKHHRKVNELIFGENIDEVPLERWLLVGDKVIQDWTSLVLNRVEIRKHWKILDDLSMKGKNSQRLFSESEYTQVQELINKIFVDEGYLANSVNMKAADGSILKFDNKNKKLKEDYLFLGDLRKILSADVERKEQNWLGLNPDISKSSFRSDVVKLKELLRDKLPLLTMRTFDEDGRAAKKELINQLYDYTLDKTLGNVTKRVYKGKDKSGKDKYDVKLLDNIDRAKIRLLQQSGFLSPKFDMMDVKTLYDDFGKLFEQFKNKHEDLVKSQELDNISNFMRYLANRGSKDSVNLANEIRDFKFFEQLQEAAKSQNTNVFEFSKTLFENFEKHLKPYMRDSDGSGFIQTGKIKASVHPGYLGTLVTQLDLLNYKVSQVTHKQLMEDLVTSIGKKWSIDNSQNEQINQLLAKVHNTIYENPSRASTAIQILSRANLYDSSKRLFTFDEGVDKIETVRDIIKDVQSQLNLQFQVFKPEVDLEIVRNADRIEQENKYPSDKPVTLNLDAYIKKYNIENIPITAGKTLQSSLKANTNALKNAWNFIKFIKSSGAKVEDSYKNKHFIDWEKTELKVPLEEFLLDTVSIYNQIRNSKTKRMIHAYDSAETNPKWSEETYQDNPVFQAIDELTNELMLVNSELKYIDDNGNLNTIDIRKSGKEQYKYEQKFYDILSEKVAVSRKRGASQIEQFEDATYASFNRPVIVAWLSNMGNGIAIPIGTQSNRGISHAMNNVVKGFIKAYSQRKNELPSEVQNNFDKFIKTNLKDFNAKENEPINLDSDGWEYATLKNPKQMSEDFTVMLTNAVGNKVMGDGWWDSVKGDNWQNSENLAKKHLKYMKLLWNRSAKKLDKKNINDLIDILEKKEMEFLSNDIIGETKSLKKDLYRLSKDVKQGGGTRWHYIEDELNFNNDNLPNSSSLFRKIKQQIQDEQSASGERVNNEWIEDVIDLTGEGKFGKGGLQDVSMFDSINVVSKKYMRVIRYLMGISDRNVETVKPIGGLASDGNAVWLDKTVWITDDAWEGYFTRNKIDGVKMGSSVKMAGEQHIGKQDENGKYSKAVYLDEYDSMESLQQTGQYEANKIISLPIETFGVTSFVKPNKDATIPIQLGNELTTPALNQQFFNWLFRNNLKEFMKDSSQSYGAGNIDNVLKYLNINDLDTSSGQLSLLDQWVKKGLDPTYFIFEKTVRNNVKKHLLDNRGIFTPKNSYGTQSNMVPTWAGYGTDNSLRFSTFRTNVNTKQRVQWTYGQIEIDDINRTKEVNVRDVQFIEHNKSLRDKIVKVKDIGNKDIEKLLDGSKNVTLETLYNELQKYNESIKDLDTSYEVAIVAHRTPTTRPSDKVIVGLKGFGLTGNSVRINHADAWLRLEADHDLDKLNYWWDTPDGILKHWDSLGGQIDSIKGEQARRTVDGLNIWDGESLKKYNFSERDSQFQRGIVVKSRRLVQWFQNYRNPDWDDVEGFSIKLGERAGRIAIASKEQQQVVEELIAKDIQRVVHAQGKGMDDQIFNDGWINKILFGDGDEYPGLIRKQHYDQKEKKYQGSSDLSNLEKDIVKAAIKPYQRLLQLQTSIFENGESKPVDYDSLIDYVESYRYQMNNLHRNIYYNLLKGRSDSKNKYRADELDIIFKRNGNFVDIFNLSNLKIPAPNSGKNELDDNALQGLTAGDKMLAIIGSHDRLKMPGIKYEPGTKEDEIIMDLIGGNLKDVSEALTKIDEITKKDIKYFKIINSLDYKISKYKNNADNAMRYSKDVDINNMWLRRADRLQNLKREIQDKIMSSSKSQRNIRNRIIKQIKTELLSGRTWVDPYNNKKYNFALDSMTVRQARIKKLLPSILRSVWDKKNNKLFINIRGISDDEYLQTLATYNVLSNITGAGLNPEVVGIDMVSKWQSDISNFRRNYTRYFRELYSTKKSKDAGRDIDDIMNDAQSELENFYHDWNNVSEGLGQYFILSVMTPKIDASTVTYHKGYLMPGFRQTGTQKKFVNVGLRFFSNINTSMSSNIIDMIGSPIMEQVNWLRNANPKKALMGQNYLNQANIRKMDYIGDESALLSYNDSIKDKSEAMKFAEKDLFDSLNSNEEIDFTKVNDEILSSVGLSGDVALDYIAYRAPAIGMDLIGDIKLLADFDFLPENAITKTGAVVAIGDYNSYLRLKRNQVSVFFGNAQNNKNIFTGKKNIQLNSLYGGDNYNTSSKSEMKKIANRFTSEEDAPGC